VLDGITDVLGFCGFVVLTGPVGAGKTTLMKSFAEQNAEIFRIVEVRSAILAEEKSGSQPKLNVSQFIDAITMDLSGKAYRGSERKLRMLETALKKQERPVVVVCDEAHHMHSNTLRALKRLHELRYGFKRLMSIFLVGQPPLQTKLSTYDLREVRLRTEWFELLQFDLWAYLEKRKAIHLFSTDAMRKLDEMVKDNDQPLTPLRMNRIGELAMMIAYQVGEHEIGVDILSNIKL
ncbi:MAG TPA: AAA family ATPase, partial [Candidatus Cloacimonetes bacterium]|nr:AAA family ATPase [Candidatus Cloacimonadota bacterium]